MQNFFIHCPWTNQGTSHHSVRGASLSGSYPVPVVGWIPQRDVGLPGSRKEFDSGVLAMGNDIVLARCSNARMLL